MTHQVNNNVADNNTGSSMVIAMVLLPAFVYDSMFNNISSAGLVNTLGTIAGTLSFLGTTSTNTVIIF